MLKARISQDVFESYLRLSGTENISDIKSAYLEINGQVLSKRNKEEKKIESISNLLD